MVRIGEERSPMAAKKDYAAICSSIIDVCGGTANITGVTHCMTRLRV